MAANFFYSFIQAREELGRAIEGASAEELWTKPFGQASAGFHIRHMAGAAERLGTYLKDEPLSTEQLDALKREAEPGASAGELMAEWEVRVQRLERYVRAIDPEALRLERRVGRLGLPTTVIGLIVHIAEHSQRHLGQAITTLKMVRAMRNAG